ncbi:response regulator transcription factor [Thiohalobacter sp. COW1]|uniref:response regulator transcription factor n=1 Tax=Thiohalobacter sp. COW1 TaxID=2795687 RepID=UPI0019158F34|nr:response regulator transcription factor [Thiohalobacter sp. COW1]
MRWFRACRAGCARVTDEGIEVRIALLEDDTFQAEALTVWLEAADHQVSVRHDCAGFRAALQEADYDLLILDWILPDGSGLEVLDWLRGERGDTTPVLFITQRDRESDVVTALEHGADDYMAKPVKPLEMLARVTALARRASTPGTQVLEFGPYRIDTASRTLYRDGDRIDLTHKEFDLALYLFRNLGRLISRGRLLEAVWGTRAELNTRTVDTHISRLRNKLGISPAQGWRLGAVYQHGYRLERLEPQAVEDEA